MVAETLNDFFSDDIANFNLSSYIDPLINTENLENPVLKVKLNS